MQKREHFEAIVTDNNDPEKRMRIKVTCSGIAEDGEELPYWFEARPEVSGKLGFCFIPDIGDQVEIEINVGEDGMGIESPDPKWICGVVSEIDDNFKDGYPKIYGMWTPKGSLFLIDDNDDQESILLQATGGRVSVKLDAENETLRLTAPRIIIDGKSIFIGNPDTEGEFVRVIHRYGKKVI